MGHREDAEALGLLGERLCLDFANTVGEQHDKPQREFFTSYERLLGWSEAIGILCGDDSQHLGNAAEQHPEEAAQVLEQALALRGSIYRILSAEAHEADPEPADLDVFLHLLSVGLPQMRLVRSERGCYSWEWAGEVDDLARMLWPVAWDAAELLKSDDLENVRECAADNCHWLFLDTSRNHSRRWCDMKECGNRAKARSHYHRARDAT